MNFLHFMGVHKGRELMKPKVKPILEDLSWAEIKAISDAGQASNYFAVGDTKSIVLNGKVGTLELNNYETYVYIIDFDHNSSVEGTGISFGMFKTAQIDGIDVALCDNNYRSILTDGSKAFNMNHGSGSINTGGWKSCDLRYDILGSVEVKDQQNATSAAITNPVENTLMAALPSDLRTVLKATTKYTDNTGGGTDISSNVTSTVDYLFLLAEYEIFGTRKYANSAEQNYQTQYAYYTSTSKIKYNHSSTSSAVIWWGRSPNTSNSSGFSDVTNNGGLSREYSSYSNGLSPAFVV